MSAIEPVVVTVDLPTSPAQAFAAFAGRFADWWPAATHSLSRGTATRCSLDPAAGGAVQELAPNGDRHCWGTVQAAELGRRLRFTWHPGREPESAQWVEVDFVPWGEGTRVTLTHGGWEALGEIAPILRREYDTGWRDVLGGDFAEFVKRGS